MMVWFWGVNLWVFSRTGVDYAAIFYLGPDHLSHKEIWKIVLYLSAVIILIIPFDIFYKDLRDHMSSNVTNSMVLAIKDWKTGQYLQIMFEKPQKLQETMSYSITQAMKWHICHIRIWFQDANCDPN
ncbi:hypothetical protein YC2023_119053 [Brassica napus]